MAVNLKDIKSHMKGVSEAIKIFFYVWYVLCYAVSVNRSCC